MTEVDLHSTTDGQVWAQEFIRILNEYPENDPHDEGWMIGWFANAIETGRIAGRDEERRRDFMEKIHEVIYQAAGAATAPLLQDHPDYVFPSERVIEGIEAVLKDFGIPPREKG